MLLTPCLKVRDKIITPWGLPAYLNLPNALTFLRLLLIPVFITLFSIFSPPQALAAAIVFAVAALTDFFDGYFARRNGQITTLGKLLGPVADKLLVVAGILLLVESQIVASWLAFAIIAREIGITGLRAIAATEGIMIPADTIGKLKTFFQVVGITLLMLPSSMGFYQFEPHRLGIAFLYLALALGLISGVRYLATTIQQIPTHGNLLNESH